MQTPLSIYSLQGGIYKPADWNIRGMDICERSLESWEKS